MAAGPHLLGGAETGDQVTSCQGGRVDGTNDDGRTKTDGRTEDGRRRDKRRRGRTENGRRRRDGRAEGKTKHMYMLAASSVSQQAARKRYGGAVPIPQGVWPTTKQSSAAQAQTTNASAAAHDKHATQARDTDTRHRHATQHATQARDTRQCR